MAKINFTKRQSNAIEAPVADILVSAAAGSGKTAVLTQRIIKNLLDKDADIGIKDMLIVTYTKAAAGELKSRISAALSAAFAEDPSNKHLRRQIIDIENAHISTIHSFCMDLIREYSEELSLPLSMNITDVSQVKLIFQNVMESVIEERYEEDTENFNAFVENFVSLRDGKLSQSLLSLYDKLLSYPDGVEYVKKSAEKLEKIAASGFDDSDYADEVKAYLSNMAKFCLDRCEAIIYFLNNSDEEYKKQLPALESDRAFLSKLVRANELTYEELRELINGNRFAALKATKNKCSEYIACEEQRSKYKERISKFAKQFLNQSDESVRKSAQKSAHFCYELYKTLHMFDQRIIDEKLKRAILDYSDLERYAHKLLCIDGRASETARKVCERYKQIYIDEYQDISPIQDELFSAIGTNNRFMVGDIKQSIYGFRGSAPELFASYRESFQDYIVNSDQKQFKIFLTENFRCDKNIIDFSNMVFESLFVHDRAEVPYLPEDALVCQKKAEDDMHQKVTVALVEYSDPDEKEYCEARYVAGEIKRLINSGVAPCDIAIMLRKTKNVIETYLSELERVGVKYLTTSKKNLFDQPEIMLVMSMLECIDNTGNDIAMSAALKSPVFALTLEELSYIAFQSEKSIYHGLIKYASENDDELAVKCHYFLKWLEKCRIKAKEISSDELIRYIYSDLALEAVVRAGAENPDEVADNLNRIYQLASEYESGSFKGLCSFVKHINRMKEAGLSSDSGEPGAHNADKVNVITVHQSKGLEYKYCFLCDLARNVNNPDASAELLIDRKLGISLRLRDDTGYVKYDTLMRKAGALHITRSLIDEEMRVLYVALTRAKHKLYVTAKTSDAESLIKNSQSELGVRPSYYGYSAEKSFIKWILSSCKQSDCYEIKAVSCTDDKSLQSRDFQKNETEISSMDFEELKKIIDFEYHGSSEANLPSKLAVSVLHPSVLDEDEDAMNRKRKELHDFMQSPKSSTGAERGTATHLFMQFCDFDLVERNGVEAELERLTREKYMTSESAKLVYVEKVMKFFSSELYNQMKSSKALYREYRFNVLIDAAEFTDVNKEEYRRSKSRILVQGVIDCFFETNDGEYKIVDYKTDKAFGENPCELIANEYRYQLAYYKTAIEKITKKKVSTASIYAFDLGQEIVIDI